GWSAWTRSETESSARGVDRVYVWNALFLEPRSNARRERQGNAWVWVPHRRTAAVPEVVGCAIPGNRPTCRAAHEHERVSPIDDERGVSSDRRSSHSGKRVRRSTAVCNSVWYPSSITYPQARWCE